MQGPSAAGEARPQEGGPEAVGSCLESGPASGPGWEVQDTRRRFLLLGIWVPRGAARLPGLLRPVGLFLTSSRVRQESHWRETPPPMLGTGGRGGSPWAVLC